MALVMVLMGVVIFYMIPMAFIFENLDLVFSALNIILMCTVIGLILLSGALLFMPAISATSALWLRRSRPVSIGWVCASVCA